MNLPKSIHCVHCGLEFNPMDPEHRRIGKVNECKDCATEPEPVRTGNMVYVDGPESAPVLQINRDPRITRRIARGNGRALDEDAKEVAADTVERILLDEA